jgi:Metallo-beta-lactamase superfamily.
MSGPARATFRTTSSRSPRAGRWRLLDGDGPILPGIAARLTPGHVPWHQAVVIESEGETAAFIADLVPTASHLALPWIMGYDVEPLRTLESKRALLRDAADGGWLLVFEHDATTRLGRATWSGSSVVLGDPVPAAFPASAPN